MGSPSNCYQTHATMLISVRLTVVRAKRNNLSLFGSLR